MCWTTLCGITWYSEEKNMAEIDLTVTPDVESIIAQKSSRCYKGSFHRG